MLLSLAVINGEPSPPVLPATAESCVMLRYICGCALSDNGRGGVAGLDVGSVEVDLQLRERRYNTIQ